MPAGQPGGSRADKLLWQAALALDPAARACAWSVKCTGAASVSLRRSGVRSSSCAASRGARVRRSYALLAQKHGVAWKRRSYDPNDWDTSDLPNRCLSAATACLHGLAEAAVLAAGYAPAIGFLHTGKPRSFVYDIADLWKTETVVPEAFRVAAQAQKGRLDMPVERAVRLACRDSFRLTGLLAKIIPQIEEVLTAGDLPKPEPAPEAVGPAFPDNAVGRDAGHRG